MFEPAPSAPIRIHHPETVDQRRTPARVPSDRGDFDEGLRLSQLLCSRLCHDLIGPVGVAASGADLLGLSDDTAAEATSLIIESAQHAARRLAFFRVAFGHGRGDGPGPSLRELRALTESMVAGGRLSVVWTDDGRAEDLAQQSPAPVGRLVLCLFLVAMETLPRGGALEIAIARRGERFDLVVDACGRAPRLTSEALASLSAAGVEGMTSRTVVGYYAGRLARSMEGGVRVSALDAERLRFAATVVVGSAPQRASLQ